MAGFVYQNYPVRNLPEDLRKGFDMDDYATLTIETDGGPEQNPQAIASLTEAE